MNNENKNKLIELMFQYLIDNKVKILQILRCSKIFLSSYDYCYCISLSEVIPVSFLTTPQEEADTKIIRHSSYALTLNATNVVIQFPSGDTDIIILAVSLVQERDKIYVDNGNSKNIDIFQLSQL